MGVFDKADSSPEVGSERFQLDLKNRLIFLETNGDINDAPNKLMRIIRHLGYNHFRQTSYGRQPNLSRETLQVMGERRGAVNATASDLQVHK